MGCHGNTPSRVRGWLDEAGLTLHSAHARPPIGTDADAIFDEHAELGKPVLILNGNDFVSLDEIARLADVLNEAAHRAAVRGMAISYHNHHAEFSNQFEGRSAYELLVERLVERVLLEVDLYRAAVGGADPAALLGQLGRQVRFVHVKVPHREWALATPSLTSPASAKTWTHETPGRTARCADLGIGSKLPDRDPRPCGPSGLRRM